MHYDMKESGIRIRRIRLKMGYTQEKVAGLLNVSRSVYSRIEAGKCGCSVDLFIQFSNLFGVSLDYLILGKYSDAILSDTEKAILMDETDKLIVCLEQIRASL